jgi:AmpD protein
MSNPLTIGADHWLSGARRRPSPNCDERPANEISLLVIHGISLPPGQFGDGLVDRLFCNTLDCSRAPQLAELAGVKVSAHLLIDRTGAISQYVAFDKRAWHAGESCWRGRVNCNDFAVGIELEGADDIAYAAAQYAVLVDVADALLVRYPGLHLGSVVGHQDIAPGRKTDPGASFDWSGFLAALGLRVRRRVEVADRY